MPSVFTIQGPDLTNPRRTRGKRRRSKRVIGRRHHRLGSSRDCKCVYNPKTGTYSELCYVGKAGGSRTGWEFTKGGAKRCGR